MLITGAASGIGRSIARLAAGEGARLILTDIDAAGLAAAVAGIEAQGGEVLHHAAFDVSDIDAVTAFEDAVAAKVRSVDILVNNAGIAIWGRIEDMTHEDWRQVIEVNLMGPIHILERFVPPMIAAGRGGHIVNVSSAAGLFGLPWHAAYSASKFGLRGISEVLRFDLRKHRIRVSLVLPGGVDTGIVQSVKIAGFDMRSPRFQKYVAGFRGFATSSDEAARRILDGVARGKYHVYTSNEIAIGHFFQRVFPASYEAVMRGMNRGFDRIARKVRG